MHRRCVYRGQSLAEYTLVAGLLVISGVAGMQMLVGLFAEKQATMWNSFSANAPRTQTLAAAGAGAGGTGATAFTSGTNYPLNIQGYEAMMADMSDIVETSGGAGATKELAAYMKGLAEQALKEGTIDEAQANLFQELANKGHDLGLIQDSLVSAIENAPDSMKQQEFARTPLTVNGKTMEIYKWVRQLDPLPIAMGDVPPEGLGDLLFRSSFSRQAEVLSQAALGGPPGSQYGKETLDSLKGAEFTMTYHELEQSGAMSNPELAPVVEQLAKTVSELSQSASEDLAGIVSIYSFEEEEPMGKMRRQEGSSYVSMKSNAKRVVQTHLNSAGICTVGGNQDTGTFCH